MDVWLLCIVRVTVGYIKKRRYDRSVYNNRYYLDTTSTVLRTDIGYTWVLYLGILPVMLPFVVLMRNILSKYVVVVVVQCSQLDAGRIPLCPIHFAKQYPVTKQNQNKLINC